MPVVEGLNGQSAAASSCHCLHKTSLLPLVQVHSCLRKTSLLPLERCAVVVVPQEVAETFLRCVKERFAEDNVVIELNALKIAEDRTFADCARYILTTLLALCLPAPAWVSPEYVTLFASDVPDTTAKDGKLQLLGKFKKQMTKWQALLKRFLNSEDDQVQIAEWMMVLVILMELVTMLV